MGLCVWDKWQHPCGGHSHRVGMGGTGQLKQDGLMQIFNLVEKILSTWEGLFKEFILNWRIFVLQYCVGFFHIITWISHKYTCVLSLLNYPRSPTPSVPDCHGVLCGAFCVIQHLPISSLFRIWHCMLPRYSLRSSHLLFPCCVQSLFSMSLSLFLSHK